MELALRFLVLSEIPLTEIKSVGDVGNFLTERITALANNKRFNMKKSEQLFASTFALLDKIFEERAFKRYSVKKSRHEGGFLLSLYETVGLGIAFNIAKNTLCDESEIIDRARSVWTNKEFTDWATAGVTANRRLPKLIPLGRDLFKR